MAAASERRTSQRVVGGHGQRASVRRFSGTFIAWYKTTSIDAPITSHSHDVFASVSSDDDDLDKKYAFAEKRLELQRESLKKRNDVKNETMPEG